MYVRSRLTMVVYKFKLFIQQNILLEAFDAYN